MGAYLCALSLAVSAAAPVVRADVMSDQPAAILVFPKVVVDTTTPPQISPPRQIDTLFRVSNTSGTPIYMRCFYVNATTYCADSAGNRISGSCVSTPVDCSGTCTPQWQETDFVVHITAHQPIAWLASQGATSSCSASNATSISCLPLSLQAGGVPGPKGQNNDGSLIPPVGDDPFIGELRCVATDQNGRPVERNDLEGEAQIVRSSPIVSNPIDIDSYNAIGIPAISGTNNGDNTLVLGGGTCSGGSRDQVPCTAASDCPGGTCSAEYGGCPNLLILDHFFDGANDPISGLPVHTDLTLVPCSADFLTQQTFDTTVQFLVFNEFEQRLSTSRHINCFQQFPLSSIDKSAPNLSIFSAAVQGTLTGQTRLSGVAVPDQKFGHTLLGVAEEFRQGGGTTALNLHFDGARPESDFLYLSPP